HVPLPIADVNLSMVGSGVPQAQAVADEHVQVSVQTWPAPHPPPHGGSHCSIPALMPLPHRLVVQLESQPSPSTVLPSSHSSPASIVWLPHKLGSVVVVVFAGQSVTRGLHVPCGVHVSVKRSLSTRFALPFPALVLLLSSHLDDEVARDGPARGIPAERSGRGELLESVDALDVGERLLQGGGRTGGVARLVDAELHREGALVVLRGIRVARSVAVAARDRRAGRRRRRVDAELDHAIIRGLALAVALDHPGERRRGQSQCQGGREKRRETTPCVSSGTTHVTPLWTAATNRA